MNEAEGLEEIFVRLRRRWGIHVPDTQRSTIAVFLRDRLRGASWSSYVERLEADGAERQALIDVATVGETYFFRDEAQFSTLRHEILPRFRRGAARMPLLWSAACSTGEEALSLLLVLADAWGVPLEACRGHVIASDVNRVALDAFASGEFRASSLREDGQLFHPLLLRHGARTGGRIAVTHGIVDLIPRRQINLITDDFGALPPAIDVIFLRNMMIYVPIEERSTIYRKVVARLSPDGVLILGKAELPFFSDSEATLAEIGGSFAFVRRTSALWPVTEHRDEWHARV